MYRPRGRGLWETAQLTSIPPTKNGGRSNCAGIPFRRGRPRSLPAVARYHVASCSHRVRARTLYIRWREGESLRESALERSCRPTSDARAHGRNRSVAGAFERRRSAFDRTRLGARARAPIPATRTRRHVRPAIGTSPDGGKCRHAIVARLGARASDSRSPSPRCIAKRVFPFDFIVRARPPAVFGTRTAGPC